MDEVSVNQYSQEATDADEPKVEKEPTDIAGDSVHHEEVIHWDDNQEWPTDDENVVQWLS